MTEQPIYVLVPNKVRLFLPQVLLYVLLGGAFYGGVQLNMELLELTAYQQEITLVGAVAVMMVLLGIGIYSAWKMATRTYVFYPKFLQYHQQTVFYAHVTKTMVRKSWLDQLFGTYALDLGDEFVIRGIDDATDLQAYVSKLIAFAQR